MRQARTERERDGRQRKEDRDRDDQLRGEADQKWEQRTRAEQRDREDHEARQVTTEVTRGGPQLDPPGHRFNHRIVVSTPTTYAVKYVDVQIIHQAGGNLGSFGPGHAGEG
jgi:hypothetical protein